MYRDDLAASHARVEQLELALRTVSSQSVADKRRIATLTAQLAAMRKALARIGQTQPIVYPGYVFVPRSGAILAFGILSLLLCALLGPVAWAMGNEELRRIDAGETSPRGRGAVVAGRVCGIISSLLLVSCGFMAVVLTMVATHHG